MVNAVAGELDLSTLGFGRPAREAKDSLGQDEFLKLMTTQLQNQDPFKPLDSGDFLGQLAQFGTVSGLAELKTLFSGLSSSLVSNQALQAAGLVGRHVLVWSGTAELAAGEELGGAVNLPTGASAVRVQVRDESGQVVRELELGAQSQGLARFRWDGRTDGGAEAPAGHYSVTAQYQSGGTTSAAETLISAPVESVIVGARGLTVQVRGLGAVPFSAVHEFGNP